MNILSVPRFEVPSALSTLRSTATEDGSALSAVKQKHYRKSKILNFGAVGIRYQEYKNTGGKYFTLFWPRGVPRPPGQKPREHRSSFAALKKRAEQIATSIANGKITMAQFGDQDRARWLATLEHLAGTGIAPEIAASIIATAQKLLAGRASILEAIRAWLADHPVHQVERTTAQIVTDLLAKKKDISPKWRRMLQTMLDRFAEKFPRGLAATPPREIEDWLDALPGGLRTRHNYRNAIVDLVHFAQRRNYLPRDWDALSSVTDPEPAPAAINLYTPDELARLLNKAETYKAGRKLVPLIAITAFAGVRHGEMNEEKIHALDWSDFDWESKKIYVQRDVAKTGRDRPVDMPDNLVAWLQPYKKSAGKVVPLVNTSNALCRLRQKAGITGPKKNALRKSFITYKLALTENIDGVAYAAGNSPAIIKKNYNSPDTRRRSQAQRWFAISPVRITSEDCPLFAWGAKPR